MITFIEIHVQFAAYIEIMRNNMGITSGGVFFARSLQRVKFIINLLLLKFIYILIVVYVFLLLVYVFLSLSVFLLLSMYSYCSSMYF